MTYIEQNKNNYKQIKIKHININNDTNKYDDHLCNKKTTKYKKYKCHNNNNINNNINLLLIYLTITLTFSNNQLFVHCNRGTTRERGGGVRIGGYNSSRNTTLGMFY